MPPLREATIIIDSREQVPLLFPKSILLHRPSLPPLTVLLHTLVSTLTTGDYALLSHEGVCLVERKASIAEVSGNCLSKDRERFERTLARLADVAHPYLLLEGSPADLLRPSERAPSPEEALSCLLSRLTHHRITPIFAGRCSTPDSRRAAGSLVAHLLLSHLPPSTGQKP